MEKKPHPPKGANHTPPKVPYRTGTLSVLKLLRGGLRPAEIYKKNMISKRTVIRALRELQSVGLIKKVGLGTWEIIPQEGAKKKMPITPPIRCQSSHHVAPHHTPHKVPMFEPRMAPNLKPGMFRGHGVVATIKIPRFPNWTEREKALKKKKIEYLPIPQGQRIKVGWIDKVWLTGKPSIVIYFPPGTSWFGEDIETVAVGALDDTLKTLTRIERMVGIKSLKIRGHYWIKFSRQHHAQIFNVLAKRYKKRGGKIHFKNEVGIWGLIDYSPLDGVKLDEFETVRGEKEFKPYDPYRSLEEQITPDKAGKDDLQKNIDWANGVQRTGITPEFILERFNDTTTLTSQLAAQITQSHEQMLKFSQTVSYLDKNMMSHVGAINNLSSQATENAKTTVSLREAVERLSLTIREGTMPYPRTPKPVQTPPKTPKELAKIPSPPLAARLEEKKCVLCLETRPIPANKTCCAECEKLIAPHKKKAGMTWDYSSPLRNYMS